MPISKQQRLYADFRIQGFNKTECARLAGYAEKTAKQQAQKLEQMASVNGYWKRAGFDNPPPVTHSEEIPVPILNADNKTAEKAVKVMEKKTHGKDALNYLASVMKDSGEDPKLRIEAAKFLAKREDDLSKIKKPTGKAKEDAAKEAAGKFAPMGAPKLTSVK